MKKRLFLAVVTVCLVVMMAIPGWARTMPELKAGSYLRSVNDYLFGVPLDTTSAQLSLNFKTEVTVKNAAGETIADTAKIGTGYTVNSGSDQLEIIISGDVNGDSRITSADYMWIKSLFDNTRSLTGASLQAADVDNSGHISSTDYLRIKKFLGRTYDLYGSMNIVPDPEFDQLDSLQLISDNNFTQGFTVRSQKDHSNNDSITDLGDFNYGDSSKNPVWILAQWDSGPCLWNDRVSSDAYTIKDQGSKAVTYNPVDESISLYLDTSYYYQGNPSTAGGYWPHLLIEQPNFGSAITAPETKAFYQCDSDKMILSFRVAMPQYKQTVNPQDWTEAAQLLMYFYVSSDAGDFVWFGIQIFDSRYEKGSGYLGYDGGKPDASNAMIYGISSNDVFGGNSRLWKNGKPYASDDWIYAEIDLKPYLEDLFIKGKAQGYFKVDSLEDLSIKGMNAGWEVIGTFQTEAKFKDICLTSYRAK